MRKSFRLILAGLGLLSLCGIGAAMITKYNQYLANDYVAYNKTYVLNLDQTGVDNMAVTAVITSGTFSAATFTDGQASTASIVVSSPTLLTGAVSTNSISVLLSTIPTTVSATININGISLVSGTNWFIDNSATMTATSIKNAINTYVPGVIASTSGLVGNLATVCTSATVVGLSGNNMTMSVSVSSPYFAVQALNFTGGRDQGYFTVNNVTFVQGNQWTDVFYSSTSANPVWNTTGTAASIATAINASSMTNFVVAQVGVQSPTTVFTTSTIVGLNYAVGSSSQTQLQVVASSVTTATSGSSTATATGGVLASYGLLSNNATYYVYGGSATVINIPNHGYTTGLQLAYTTASAAQQGITGLGNCGTYYAIVLTPNAIALASSSALAQINYPLIMTSSQTKTVQDLFTLTPSPISGTPTLTWQVSNDGLTWTPYSATLTGQAIVTPNLSSYYSSGTVLAFDFGPIDYELFRASVTAPTAGAVKVVVSVNGKGTTQ